MRENYRISSQLQVLLQRKLIRLQWMPSTYCLSPLRVLTCGNGITKVFLNVFVYVVVTVKTKKSRVFSNQYFCFAFEDSCVLEPVPRSLGHRNLPC